MNQYETKFQDEVKGDAEIEILIGDEQGLIVNVLTDEGDSAGVYLSRAQGLELAHTLLAYGYGAL